MFFLNVLYFFSLIATAVFSNRIHFKPIDSVRDKDSIIIFGYDLLSMGNHRSEMISRFINSLLPYTGYGYYKVVSYPHCPQNVNIPVTSLMDKNYIDIERSVLLNAHIPDTTDVVRQMRSDLHGREIRNLSGGGGGRSPTNNQVAVVFVDPSVTTITPELLIEMERLRRQCSNLFVVSVGRQKCCRQPRRFASLAGRSNTYFYPSYKQLLRTVRRVPFRFRSMCHRYASSQK